MHSVRHKREIRWRLIEFVEKDGKIDDALLRKDKTHTPLTMRGGRVFIVTDDLFHPTVPDGWIDLVVAIAAARPKHTFIAPTFNHARAREYWQLLETEPEESTAARLAIAIHRGLVPKPESFVWPLPNLTYREEKR